MLYSLRPVVSAPLFLILLAVLLAEPVWADAPTSAPDSQRSAVSQNMGRAIHPDVSNPPYTVTLTGPTKDSSSGNLNILVGQKCTATISLPPFVYGTTLAYQWKVSGTTFQSWSVSHDSSYTTLSGGSGDLTQSSPSWYWNDPNNTMETITCTVTATAPSGQTNTSNGGSGTKSVTVQLPQWTATGTGGYMQVNTFDPAYPASDYAFYAGPTLDMDNNGQPGGINFKATSITPPLFGQGSLEMVQLVTPKLSYTTNTKPPVVHTDPEQSQGLDVHYPKSSNGASGEGATPYLANDIPGMDLTAYNAGAASENHQFIDYLLYLPPASSAGVSMWITLAQFNWSVDGTATLPDSGLWSGYVTQNGSDNAGTVTPSGPTATPFTSVYGPDFFVSWTKINVFPSF